MRHAHLVRPVAALAALLACASCQFRQFQFTRDNRVHIAAPTEDQLVGVPFTVRWTWHDFTISDPAGPATRHSGYFGVFIDSEPPAPGRLVSSLFRSDKECQQRPGCPGAADYQQRGIYFSREGTVTVTDRAMLSTTSDPEQHTVTIVLLDRDGRRIGETAWFRDFRTRPAG